MDEARLFAQKVAVGAVLEGAQEVLARANVSAVVLKGAWLLTEVYPPDALRPTMDVDLLVREMDFQVAMDAFKLAGFSVHVADWREVVLRHAELPLPIDLHRAVFPRRTFALGNAEVFTRSRASAWSALRFPGPLDGIANIVGHFALSRDLSDNLLKIDDIQIIADHFQLVPDSCAEHLCHVGLQRATRYVTEAIIAHTGAPQPFCEAVLNSLPVDPLGRAIVKVCRATLPRVPLDQPAGALLTCLLERDMLHALMSGASRARDVLTHRLLHRRR